MIKKKLCVKLLAVANTLEKYLEDYLTRWSEIFFCNFYFSVDILASKCRNNSFSLKKKNSSRFNVAKSEKADITTEI